MDRQRTVNQGEVLGLGDRHVRSERNVFQEEAGGTNEIEWP